MPTSPARGVPRFNAPRGTLAAARRSHSSHRTRRSSPLGSFFSPFFGDSFDLEDLSQNGSPSAAPPFLLEATRALSGPKDFAGQPDTHGSSGSQPLLIELQGDRYVRVTSAAVDGEALPLQLSPDNLHRSNVAAAKSTRNSLGQSVTQNSGPALASPARDLAPAVLVFRDGHIEQVRDYAIAAGFLYARGNYYTDGYWNKTIDLSTLDIVQTIQTNHTRHVTFVLPSSPNEVITRP